MRVLVTGSREWTDGAAVFLALHKLWVDLVLATDSHDKFEMVVVHGHNPRGADAFAHEWGTEQERNGWGVRVEAHPADWNTHGKKAGILRNQEMLDLGVDVCLAFPLPGGRGTQDMMRRARKAGVPVLEFQEKEIVS